MMHVERISASRFAGSYDGSSVLYLADTSSGNVTLTLRDSSLATRPRVGQEYILRHEVAGNTLTLATENTDLINGASTWTSSTVDEFLHVVATGTGWISISGSESSSVSNITTLTPYTPTGTFTTNTTYVGMWRRVGDTMEVRIDINFSGAPNSTTLTSVSIPSGYTIDTAKLPSAVSAAGQIGNCSFLDAATATYNETQVVYSSTTSVRPYGPQSASVVASVTQAFPFTFGSGDKIFLDFKVPITGWS